MKRYAIVFCASILAVVVNITAMNTFNDLAINQIKGEMATKFLIIRNDAIENKAMQRDFFFASPGKIYREHIHPIIRTNAKIVTERKENKFSDFIYEVFEEIEHSTSPALQEAEIAACEFIYNNLFSIMDPFIALYMETANSIVNDQNEKRLSYILPNENVREIFRYAESSDDTKTWISKMLCFWSDDLFYALGQLQSPKSRRIFFSLFVLDDVKDLLKNSYQLNLNSTYVVHFAYYLRDMPDFISMHGSRARCVLSYSETAVEHLREIFTVSLRSGKYQLENLYNFMNSYNLDRVMGLLDVELESSRFFIENFLYSLKIGNTKRHRGAMKDVIASSDICDIFKVHLVYYKRYADSDRFSHINDLFYMVRFARKKADQCKSRNMFNDLFHMIFISIDLNDIETSIVRCNELFRYEVRQWNNRYDFEFSTDF